ncbi:2-C-methyl-D-erythritol 4-phosphate cytidylyltransferase [Armatimonas sp.]|uniref:2-C-methyl-D-erythritol 4-phosphate cytidylyltransferase n=1 Tax=Armatimonas sp. TaxID=1872638 RepID=UPI00286B1E49|nr:2-C-methyl-D-erythritol 4-phosphate cytidylyltransferase [Armatimonas sp.]
MRNQPAVTALLPAAGRGERFGSEQNKILSDLLGRPILAWTLEAFAQCDDITRIVLVGSEGDSDRLWELGDQYAKGKLQAVVLGGSTRQESVRRGLDAVGTEYVLVHDAARCCITTELISEAVGATRIHQAMTVVRTVTDTLMRRSGELVDRKDLMAVETPQGFQTDLLRRAHLSARTEGFIATDDASLLRRLGRGVHLLESTTPNPKITYAADLLIAVALLTARTAPQLVAPLPSE